jgi:hypothetical protein
MQNKFCHVSNLINSTGFDLQVSGDQGPTPLCLRRLEVRAQFGLRRVQEQQPAATTEQPVPTKARRPLR